MPISPDLDALALEVKAAQDSARQIVTTGTITTAHTVSAGETWQSEIQGIALPGLRVDFSL